jgi:hypothetical protein
MSVNVQIYNNVNNVSTSITIDFETAILPDGNTVTTTEYDAYFSFVTSALDEGGEGYPVKIIKNLSTLALNNNVRSSSNSSVAYGNVHAMVVDYLYDYINGHTANQYASGVDEKLPMRF